MNGAGPRILDDLKDVPEDATCLLVIRHSTRDGALDKLCPDTVSLNHEGEQKAKALGEQLRDRPFSRLHSSPAARCVRTCQCVAEGYGTSATVQVSGFLGMEGPAILRPKEAAETMTAMGFVPFVEAYVRGELDGAVFLACPEGTSRLISWAACKMRTSKPGVSVAVTHDLVLTPMLVYLFGYDVRGKGLITFLDGLVLYEKDRRILARHGGKEIDVTSQSSNGYD